MTLRIAAGLGSLRTRATFPLVNRALTAASSRFGFRLVQFVVMSNHIHLLCEVDGSTALSRAIKGLSVRIARALNRSWKRSGSVFADRYHVRVLKTPREVKNALTYVFRNAAHHGIQIAGPDPCSSARWFEDDESRAGLRRDLLASPIPRARTWLLADGWKRHGSISTWARDARA